MKTILPTINILDVKVNTLSFYKCLQLISLFVLGDKPKIIVTPNPEIILTAQKNQELKQILNEADLSLPDGFGLILASWFKIKRRITGADIMREIIEKYPRQKYKFILSSYGLSSKEDIKASIKVPMDESNPDIIFVALGCPAQEKWIKNNRQKFPTTKIIMTVGGGIDFLTGKQQRAPLILRKIGLEWLYRLIKQPNRIWRIINAIIIFPFRVLFS